MEIYDVSGRLIRELNNPESILSEDIAWIREDQMGCSVPAGIYFIRITLDSRTETGKVILLR